MGKKKSNTLLDRTVLNKAELSFWVCLLMIHAQRSQMRKVAQKPTTTYHMEKLSRTPKKVLSPWTVSPVKNRRTITMTEMMPKTKMRSLKCVNKSTKVPENAKRVLNRQDTCFRAVGRVRILPEDQT